MQAPIAPQRNTLSISRQKTEKPTLSHKDIQSVIWELQWRVIKIEDISPEKEALLATLNGGVIWQAEACEQIADIVDTGLNRVLHKKWPLGVAFLSWPTWVGKTETVRMLAKHFFGDEEAFIFMPGEQFQDQYSITKLHGSADGLVGFGKKWYFHRVGEHHKTAQKLRKTHQHVADKTWFSVLLVDEVEKAHPKVRQSFLSILEEWKVKVTTNKSTDGDKNNYKDEVIDLSDTLIVFTSNIWESEIAWMNAKNEVGFWRWKQSKDVWEQEDIFMKSLKEEFSPEFLWRVWEPIRFQSISREDAWKIVIRRIEDINSKLTWYFRKWNIHIWINDEAIEFLLERWFSSEKGARALGRIIKQNIERPVNRILKENANEAFMTRKNPTIINFWVSAEWGNLEAEFYFPEIVEEDSIIDSDEIYDIATTTVDQIWNALQKAQIISTIYSDFSLDGFTDEEVDLLSHLDEEYLLATIFDTENFFDGVNVLSDADVFWDEFSPRWIRSLIERKTKTLYRTDNYSKHIFILTAIVKAIPIVEKILWVSELSEEQEQIIVRFATMSALKIW